MPHDDLHAPHPRDPEAESGSGLGAVRRRSNLTRRKFSAAGMLAARNLLEKASDRLDRLEPDAARRLVERALAIPHDDFEEADPGVWQAHMGLYSAIDDLVEEWFDDEDGERWLDQIETVLRDVDTVVAREMRVCLAGLPEAGLSRAQVRRLRTLTAGVEPNTEPLAGVTDHAERVDAVLAVLETTSRVVELLLNE